MSKSLRVVPASPAAARDSKQRAALIRGWLNAVKTDGSLETRLTCYAVAAQLAEKTNRSEFDTSGKLVGWQSEPTIGKAIGRSERTVRRVLGRLEAAGHIVIERRPGWTHRYTLVTPDKNVRTPPRTILSDTPDKIGQNPGQKCPPNLIEKHLNKTGAPTIETEISGPRSRVEDALGPPNEQKAAVTDDEELTGLEVLKMHEAAQRAAREANRQHEAKQRANEQHRAAMKEAEQHLIACVALVKAAQWTDLGYEWQALDKVANQQGLGALSDYANELLHLIAWQQRLAAA